MTISVVRERYARLNELLRKNNNIVCVGGPLGNPLTRMAMSTNPITLAFRGVDIVDSVHQAVHVATIDNDALLGIDYGLLFALPNTIAKEGRIVVAAGCHGYGTHGAAMVLANIERYPELVKNSKGFFEALIEVPFEQGVVAEPKVLLSRPITM